MKLDNKKGGLLTLNLSEKELEKLYEVIDKGIPKKIILNKHSQQICPECETPIYAFMKDCYCYNCGQKLELPI